MRNRSKSIAFILCIAAIAVLIGASQPSHANTLRGYAAAGYTPVGSVARAYCIQNNPGAYNSTLNNEYNLLGAENELKMYNWTGWNGDPMTGTPIISDNWAAADTIANFARSHGMRMRGHCLVYHTVVPQFLNPNGDNSSSPYTDAQIQSMVRIYINTIMRRYADVIDYWDVTNEMFHGDGTVKNTWTNWSSGSPVETNDFWLQHLGGYNVTSYFNNIYSWAHAAVPNCKLYYNDFGTEYPGTEFNGMLNTLTTLRNNGCPIDGIGFQCHDSTGSPSQVLSTQNTQAVDNAGFQWQVTEFDCWTPAGSPDWTTQNSIYSGATNICTNDKNCRGFMTWGFTDAFSWLPTPDGLPFDTSYNKKTGYWAIDYMYANAPVLGPAGWMYACDEWNTKYFSTPVDVAFGAGNNCWCQYGDSGNVTFTTTAWGGDPAPGTAKNGYFTDYTWCAPEWGSYTFTMPVDVAFGANGSYYYNTATSGTVSFNTTDWGGDPAPGYSKSGYYKTYNYACGENGTYTLPGVPCNVAYGANGHYYFMKNVTGTIAFNNSAFGGDPCPGVVKSGYWRPSH